ncbi:cation:proton antiporter domain-containing protein [Mariniblastus fucicola]|uniref:K(+)/H(+) antiporter NhaP2 n=1 Tax=Mariniblastus fucicola TaxID=980251 RepID=A0A5B9PHZ7_9BACT|nr:cation:proton antiporter [Mariniblastus fucicola]QEG24920.1 K(+)/H(+) antiporter NhaP2 [Mariniblastus fucicola]
MHSHELLLTFTTAAALGVGLFTLARYLRVSAIVILLIGGVIAGPQVLGIVNPESLGDGLGTIISLAVAIILFEGGLTLDLKGYRTVSKEIWRVLTIGVLVTWLGTALLLNLLFRFNWPFCFLAASLIIVTGPTVIGPLLHRIRVNSRLHHILHWEGVLIDPIGVFIALLSFEYFVSTDGSHQPVLTDFLLRFAAGALLGVAFGYLLDFLLRREWISRDHTNIFVLAMAMLNFAIADQIISECGLLSVTVAGLVLGSLKTPQLRGIVSYKVELKDFLIGLLFVLLAANLDLHAFLDYGWKLVAVVAGIMLIIRPLNIFGSMQGTSLDQNEKLFLSWIAPRGIVAASMASVFAHELKQSGVENAIFLETFAYSVIAGTVIVQGFTAGVVGRYLGVVQPDPTGWVIVGAHSIARQVAGFFARHGVDVVLIDTNARDVRSARREGLAAISEDAMLLNPDDHVELYECGNMLALTSNPDLNRMLCRRWTELIDGATFRWEKNGYETEDNRHLLVGSRIWDGLPLNRWVQAESTAPTLQIKNGGNEQSPDASQIMLTLRGKTVVPGTPAEIRSDDEEWLVFQPEKEASFELPLTKDNVQFSSQTNLLELYREMLLHLKSQLPSIDPEQLLSEMWKHEDDYASLLGHGVALPHSRTSDVIEPIVMVTRLQDEIACPLTGLPVEIVFMLLSPDGNPEEHLTQLSHIAHLVGTEQQRQRILHASNHSELFQTIESSV